MEETINMMREQLSKCKVVGAFIGMGVVDFWFGIGVLAVKMAQSLEDCIEELISRK